jgi:AraC-like DNA-binding protein
MTEVLYSEDDVYVAPDSWAELQPRPRVLTASEELQRQVDEFVARGGVVKEFEPGETAVAFNNPLWSFPVGKAAPPNHELREAGIARRTKAAPTKAQLNGAAALRYTKQSDTQLVATIDALMGTVKTKKGMCQKLGCSNSLLQRLLYSHFEKDPRADPYRQINRADQEAARVKLIRKHIAAGQVGTKRIADLLGIRLDKVLELDAKYGLKIPRGTSGRKGCIDCTNPLCHAKVTSVAKYCPQCGAITAVGLKKRAEQ